MSKTVLVAGKSNMGARSLTTWANESCWLSRGGCDGAAMAGVANSVVAAGASDITTSPSAVSCSSALAASPSTAVGSGANASSTSIAAVAAASRG